MEDEGGKRKNKEERKRGRNGGYRKRKGRRVDKAEWTMD